MNNQSFDKYPAGVQSTLGYLDQEGLPYLVKVFDAPARSAKEAADLIGCEIGAIVKSLVFLTQESGEPVMVLVSGKNRADLDQLADSLGVPVRIASPQDVLKLTGYAVGAVPPAALGEGGQVFIDEGLMGYPYVWASAGAEHILMQIQPENLLKLSSCEVVNFNQLPKE